MMPRISRTVFIVNPMAGNGAVRRKWSKIESLAACRLSQWHVFYTQKKGDAVNLSRSAVMQGADRIICLGGDGTFNEVINGVMDQNDAPSRTPVLGFVPLGTGCDFARTESLPVDPKQVFETIFSGQTKPIDVGKLTYVDDTGKSCSRFFHNVVSFGLGGEVDRYVNKLRGMPGTLAFFAASLLSILRYGAKTVNIRIDRGKSRSYSILNTSIANGKCHGGGMRVAPDAQTDDGIFDITVIGRMNLPQIMWNLPRLYSGRLSNAKQVVVGTGKRIEAWSKETVLLDVDGESPGRLPATVEVVPKALLLMVAN